jgi:urease accessory protein
MHRRSLPILTVALALLPGLALAHTGAGATAGFVAGVLHTISGLDHILAMVAVGLLAAHLGGQARWLVPASFLTAMAAGGLVGALGLGLPFVEPGIALSVLALGLVVALRARLPLLPAIAVVGLFAVFHGHAHGAGMPAAASALTYGAGFALTTAALHGLGLALGRAGPARLAQATGGAMALAGVGLLAGLL